MATKLVRKAGQKSLKSQGAGYSTTNRKGETTFYKSSKDAPGYNDTTQSRGDMSKGNAPISKFDSTGKVMTMDSFKNPGVADIPTPKVDATDFGSMLSVGNASLTDPSKGLTQQNGQYVYDPTKSASVNAVEQSNQTSLGYLSAIQNFLQPNANENENAYKAAEKETGLQNYQNEVNSRSSELNAIVANRDANLLKVEGQGRGIPDVIIGGQQAQINKEAAIQALPVQAQLAAAQGNLEMAQQRLDTLFKVRSADIEAKNTYKTNLANSVMQWANSSQQNILNAKLSDIKNQEARELQTLNDAKSIAMQAIEYGQSGLAGRVMGLDPKSKTYEQDVRNAMVQLRKPVANVKRDTQVVGNQLIDTQTGEVISTIAGVGNENGTVNGKPQTATQASANGYANRLTDANRVFSTIGDKFAGKFAYGAILPNQLQSAERQQFEQAKRNFINAVLRRESGAVISPTEFDNAALQYFAQPGDTPENLLQKAENRNTVINNLYNEANTFRPVVAGDIIVSSGIKYKVEDDGETITPIE